MNYQIVVIYGDNREHVIASETTLAGGLQGELSRLRQKWIQQQGFDIQHGDAVTWVLLSEVKRVTIEPIADEPPAPAEAEPIKKPKKTSK